MFLGVFLITCILIHHSRCWCYFRQSGGVGGKPDGAVVHFGLRKNKKRTSW